MLDLALGFLRDELNSFLAARTGSEAVVAKLTRLVDNTGAPSIGVDTIGFSVIQIDEEKTFRAQLPSVKNIDGQQVLQQPELKLNLNVIFAASFTHYETGLKYLSLVLTFFQSHTAFTSTQYPALDERIGKLTVELQSLTYEQLNQVWGYIGGKQLPSVFYRIRMVMLQDTQRDAVMPPVVAINTAASLR